MSLRSIAACLMITAMGMAPWAHAAPIGPKQSTQSRGGIAEAAGSASTPQGDFSFRAQSYIDFDGSRAGSVYVDVFGAGGYQFISCVGPEFANAVSLNQSNGTLSVYATINPASPSCFAYGYSGAPLTLGVSGQPDGSYRKSESGVITEQFFNTTFKYNFQSDVFGEVFTGSTGLYTGSFSGTATSSRSTNRTQAK